MISRDILGALFGVADDYEADVLEHVALKAGLLWRCSCRYVTRASLQRCCGCHARRPVLVAKQAVP